MTAPANAVICKLCVPEAWVDEKEIDRHIADHRSGYCAWESLDEPGRRCHRNPAHDGSHSEFPKAGDVAVRRGEIARPPLTSKDVLAGNGRARWRGVQEMTADLRTALSASFTDWGTVQWLWMPRPEWDGLNALEMIAVDRLRTVLDAAEEFAGVNQGELPGSG